MTAWHSVGDDTWLNWNTVEVLTIEEHDGGLRLVAQFASGVSMVVGQSANRQDDLVRYIDAIVLDRITPGLLAWVTRRKIQRFGRRLRHPMHRRESPSADRESHAPHTPEL